MVYHTSMSTEFILLGNMIKAARMGKQLSQLDLARKLDRSPSLINNFEKGERRPTLQDAFKIEYLLEMKDAPISSYIIAEDYKAATGLERRQEIREEQILTGEEVAEKIEALNTLREEKPRVMGQIISVPVKLPKDIYLKLEFE